MKSIVAAAIQTLDLCSSKPTKRRAPVTEVLVNCTDMIYVISSFHKQKESARTTTPMTRVVLELYMTSSTGVLHKTSLSYNYQTLNM
ncbi:unnamed protein product [Lactuca virosa]|uniref:Uncharacterized protein n=1 Tax=Lactuca virosa TaxID=75947 RepID=A0AAU9LP61_9ASTR|nr:unnamed protein product [Lactuca virosa]